jgi:type IV secretory pathway VirB2 component (pilin)
MFRKQYPRLFAITLVPALMAADALAASEGGHGFVWDGILESLASNFVGLVAFAVGILALVVAALHWAFGDADRAGRKLGTAIVAVAIAVGAGLLIDQIAAVSGAVL